MTTLKLLQLIKFLWLEAPLNLQTLWCNINLFYLLTWQCYPGWMYNNLQSNGVLRIRLPSKLTWLNENVTCLLPCWTFICYLLCTICRSDAEHDEFISSNEIAKWPSSTLEGASQCPKDSYIAFKIICSKATRTVLTFESVEFYIKLQNKNSRYDTCCKFNVAYRQLDCSAKFVYDHVEQYWCYPIIDSKINY